jgi:hypothetical protein
MRDGFTADQRDDGGLVHRGEEFVSAYRMISRYDKNRGSGGPEGWAILRIASSIVFDYDTNFNRPQGAAYDYA